MPYLLFPLCAVLAALSVFALRLALLPTLDISLYVDEAQYWTWAQAMDWGYFSKPPGIAALIWLSTALFGNGLLGVKALSMLCYPLTALAAYALARRLRFTEAAALWSSLLVLTLPIFSWLGLFVSTDALLTLLWTLLMLVLLNALAHDRWRDWLLLGVLCGLGLLSKYTMLVAMGSAFLLLLFSQPRRLLSGKPWLAVVVAATLLAPNIAWNVAHDFPTLRHTAEITVQKKAAGGLSSLMTFIAAQWLISGLVVGAVWLWAAWQKASWRDPAARFLLIFALPLWAVVAAQAFFKHANANWAAPAFVPAVLLAVWWLWRNNEQAAKKRTIWLALALAINVLISALAYQWQNLMPLWAQLSGRDIHSLRSPYERAQGWRDWGQALAVVAKQYPQAVWVADNRTLIAHASYELRALHPSFAAWNPEKRMSDHYRISTDLNRYRGRDLIILSDEPIAAQRFAAYVHRVGDSQFIAGQRPAYLLHLQGFKGY